MIHRNLHTWCRSTIISLRLLFFYCNCNLYFFKFWSCWDLLSSCMLILIDLLHPTATPSNSSRQWFPEFPSDFSLLQPCRMKIWMTIRHHWFVVVVRHFFNIRDRNEAINLGQVSVHVKRPSSPDLALHQPSPRDTAGHASRVSVLQPVKSRIPGPCFFIDCLIHATFGKSLMWYFFFHHMRNALVCWIWGSRQQEYNNKKCKCLYHGYEMFIY